MNFPKPPLRLAVIACDVLRDELEACPGGATRVIHREYLPMGLHDRPDHLREQLSAAIARAEAVPEVDTVVLVYGLCGNGLAGLGPRRVPLVITRAHDCVTLFMGSRERFAAHQAEHPEAFYYTPGWQREKRVPGPERLEQLRKELSERFDDPEDVEYVLEVETARWKPGGRATYIDHGLEGSDSQCAYARHCARALQWDFEAIAGDRTLLRDLVSGRWDAERFLIVAPGEEIAPSHDERVLKSARVPRQKQEEDET